MYIVYFLIGGYLFFDTLNYNINFEEFIKYNYVYDLYYIDYLYKNNGNVSNEIRYKFFTPLNI